MDKIKQSKQTINFSALGYHEQNGIAERTIRTLTAKARTMLIHPSSHWSSKVIIQHHQAEVLVLKLREAKRKALGVSIVVRCKGFSLLRVTLGSMLLLDGVELLTSLDQ